MKTALITGANGALASSISSAMRQMGRYRVVTSSRSGASTDMILDVCVRAMWDDALRLLKPDIILHLAAVFSSGIDDAYQANVNATRHMLDAILACGSGARAVIAGSAAAYGAVMPEDNPISEDHPLNPVSVYGLTKAWQTCLVPFYSSRGVDVIEARIFNLDGPGLSERLFSGRLRRQIEEVISGRRKNLEVGSLSAVRDYITIAEASAQILAIAEKGISGQVYHVASGVPVTMRDFATRILACHGLGMDIVREEASLSNHTGYDVPVIYANISRTMNLMRD